ncbi:heparinase II/III family protein [Mariniflexile sp. AS56]|uniref:heparinase II/III domain-containing protein n=1 Tax=Mariniflexile sp. AS56 TaxID=3063957 RepID=UPI0026F2815A|nr:heparinase II/III family protein [Mariniflexile sp. AS56]MDO7171583.1 heparinase II/III family protein [Mariniflexile sp. AS56]
MKSLVIYIMVFMFFGSTLMMAQETGHPRIYATNASKSDFLESIKKVAWKQRLVDEKVEKLEKYLKYVENDPTWLVSRLQMNWKTKHDKVFLKGGNFHHSEGNAPVPTVRFSGTRDWATEYSAPKLEDIEPYFDDPRGYYLADKKTKVKEWVHPSKIGHAIEGTNRHIMSLVEDAAFLYWVTGDKKYAEFAKPVYDTYIEGMYYRDAPIDLENGNQQRISGLATFEVIHEKILISLITTYDFLHDYFKQEKLNLDHSAAVFQKWGDQIVNNGIPDNNWNLFQARFLTYVALVLERDNAYKNGKGREYFLDRTFDTSTERQLSINESLLVYDQETGMWPECASYSVHVITTLLNIFTLLDNATNNNELSNFPIIEKAALSSFQYLFPSGYTVGFGDSNHKPLPPENFELLISNYRKYQNEEKEGIISGLLDQMIAKGEYERKADDLFQLFFYVNELKASEKNENGLEKLTSPTFYASNVSMFNQRLGAGNDAMMVSTAGSYGNHSHVNGISMELFANKYVLGPDMGKGSSYWHTDHREYYSRFPAHNTVVVDGISDYNAMRGYHPFKLENYFPEVSVTPTFDKLTYSKVSFFEPKAQADQQRFTAIIKGKASKGYILDVFRSKKQEAGKQRHDYFYHNLGQSLDILDSNSKALQLTATNDFGSKQGDLKAYDYLTDKKKVETSKDVQALFRLRSKGEPDNLMKVWLKGSENQSIYTALAPKANVLKKGGGTAPADVVGDPIQTLIVKRNESAWENPFAMVFNPYFVGEENPISHVGFSNFKENPSTQVINVTLSDNSIDQIILNTTEEDVVEKEGLYQKGLVSVTRKSKGIENLDYFFISGMYKYIQNGWEVFTSGVPVTLSVERLDNTFVIESDGAVVIRAPFLDGKTSAELRVYENSELVATRQGQINRSNPEQLEFRLSKAYSKVLIVF